MYSLHSPPPVATAPEPERVHLHTTIDVRSASLAVLALVASVYALHWASAVFIPLLLGVDRLQRWHISRALGAAVLLFAVLGGLGSMVYSLSDGATALAESLPDAAQKLRQPGAPESAMEKVQKAGAKLEQVAEESGSVASPAGKGVTRVQIERLRFNICGPDCGQLGWP